MQPARRLLVVLLEFGFASNDNEACLWPQASASGWVIRLNLELELSEVSTVTRHSFSAVRCASLLARSLGVFFVLILSRVSFPSTSHGTRPSLAAAAGLEIERGGPRWRRRAECEERLITLDEPPAHPLRDSAFSSSSIWGELTASPLPGRVWTLGEEVKSGFGDRETQDLAFRLAGARGLGGVRLPFLWGPDSVEHRGAPPYRANSNPPHGVTSTVGWDGILRYPTAHSGCTVEWRYISSLEKQGPILKRNPRRCYTWANVLAHSSTVDLSVFFFFPRACLPILLVNWSVLYILYTVSRVVGRHGAVLAHSHHLQQVRDVK